MNTALHRIHEFDTRTDIVAACVVVATIVVSALCFAFILHAGIAIAE